MHFKSYVQRVRSLHVAKERMLGWKWSDFPSNKKTCYKSAVRHYARLVGYYYHCQSMRQSVEVDYSGGCRFKGLLVATSIEEVPCTKWRLSASLESLASEDNLRWCDMP